MVSPTGARPSTPISLASERGVLGVVGFPQAIRSARSAEAPSWAEKRLRKGGLGMTKLEYLQKMAQAGAMLRQAGQTDHGQLAQAAQAAQGVQGNYSQIQAQQLGVNRDPVKMCYIHNERPVEICNCEHIDCVTYTLHEGESA